MASLLGRYGYASIPASESASERPTGPGDEVGESIGKPLAVSAPEAHILLLLNCVLRARTTGAVLCG